MLKKLNVTSSTTSRILQHLNSDKPCAVISAYRDIDKDTGKQVTLEENKKNTEALKKLVWHMGLGFIPLDSKFVEEGRKSGEEAICVPDLPLDKAIEIGAKFKQHSVLGKNRENQMVWACCCEGWKCPSVGHIIQVFTQEHISESDFIGAFFQLRKGTKAATNRRVQLAFLAEMERLPILPVASIKKLWVPNFVFVGEEES